MLPSISLSLGPGCLSNFNPAPGWFENGKREEKICVHTSGKNMTAKATLAILIIDDLDFSGISSHFLNISTWEPRREFRGIMSAALISET